ncbi:M13 family peptidase [Sphingomonas gilva]|uniref:M13 family peptidase n=1 Tax=Sphingomonas gilva TaxID=2305907 RepID=A0A396RPG3_9SPHN|nr:M13 family metallopeptidase [Sphingomonas gilva]RHW18259.1 M13 family peptidase [Sphingomonas gilva]
MRRSFLLTLFLLTTAPVFAQTGTVGVDLEGLDKTAEPGDSFDIYANGGWRERTEIPADRTSIGTFVTVAQLVEQRNIDIIAKGEGRAEAGADGQKIADYYAAYRDTAAIERRGTEPLKAPFAAIDRIADRRALSLALGASMRADADPLNATNFWTENLFGIFVSQALQDPTVTVPYLLQGGLGMPERDYYLSDAPEMAKVRAAYQGYVAAMLKQLGWSDADARAARIMALETKIAQAHLPAVEAQDAKKAEGWSRADFSAKAPGIDWDAFFEGARLGEQQQFIAWHAAPTTKIAALVGREPIEVWKDWMKFHIASRFAGVLPKAYDDLRFGFYGKVLSGAQQPRPRDKRAISATSGALGDAVGRIYVAKHFPAKSKADIEAMVANIKAAFDKRLQGIDWMAPATKAEARRKIETLIVGVGYPETWRDYASFEVKPGDAFGNAWRAGEFEYRHQLAKIGKPVDKAEWWMSPQTVNAVFLPLQNAMNFPAGILEPPFYDPAADPAFNYGSIGSVIGHEVSHSFDNLGADFDADGRVRNWWTEADMARFKQAGDALVKQYDAYEAFPGLNLNGELTLGENIADLAGLAAAYDAYHASLGGKPAPVIDGLTGDQRFFLAYAQSRREKTREATLRAIIAADGHSPGRWRAETVRNLDAWYTSFGAKPGEKLYLEPEARVRVW